jgi:hypothetical protein
MNAMEQALRRDAIRAVETYPARVAMLRSIAVAGDEQKSILEEEGKAETLRLCRTRDAMLKGHAAGVVAFMLAKIQSQPKRISK